MYTIILGRPKYGPSNHHDPKAILHASHGDQRDICFGHLCSVQCSKFELENEEKFHSSASLPFFFVRLQCACALANSLSFHI